MNDKEGALAILLRETQTLTADGVADAILRTTRTGVLPPGTRLPTVTRTAEALGVSTSTVNKAWASLVQMGIIETRRRGGTVVARPLEPTSYRSYRGMDDSYQHSLAAGYPDADLLIDLAAIMRETPEGLRFGGYPRKDEIAPELREHLLSLIGYEPESLMLDADVIGTLPSALQAISHRGGSLGVADPEFPLYYVLLRQNGLTPAPIPFGVAGYDLDTLARLLEAGTRAFLFQTRVHNPTGVPIPDDNLRAIAELLARYDATAIEVDHHVHLVPERQVRLAALVPDRVLLLTSFAKAFHPDLRVIAVSGPQRIVDRMRVWKAGGSWVSGVSRHLLLECLRRDEALVAVAHARAEYDTRRRVFVDRLAAVDVRVHSSAGLSLWVPVVSERETLLALAAQGIAAAPGSAFTRLPREQEHIHLSLGLVGAHAQEISAEVAAAATRMPPLGASYF